MASLQKTKNNNKKNMSRIKFQNKYRIPSARWRDWNYGDEGAYFVTICSKYREPYFGEIKDGQMQLSEIGKIAQNEWLKSMDIRPDMNLDMECFVVMPNHIHGIVIIGKNEYNSVADENGGDCICRDAMHCVSIDNKTATDAMHGVCMANDTISDAMHGVYTGDEIEWFREIELIPPANHFGPQSKNLASVMRGFKSAVTTAARQLNISFDWQTRFHDHVIRDDDEFRRIAYYIEQNPMSWDKDILNEQ
jgi:putative transposase